jgi:hypothetical protein
LVISEAYTGHMSNRRDDLGPLERVTVNLIRRTSAALRLSVRLTGLSRTDTINRHIQMGAYLEWQESRGTKFFMQEPGEDAFYRLLLSPGLPAVDEIDRMLGPDEGEGAAPETQAPATGTG